MKKTRFIASFAVLAFSGLATAATTVVTDANIADYTGAASIAIPAGDTLQFSGITSAFTLSAPVVPGKQLSLVNLKLEADGESYGKLDLGGNVAVRSLRIGDTFMPPGDYGSTASGAANPNDSHFTGTGVLHVRRASLAEGFHLILR